MNAKPMTVTAEQAKSESRKKGKAFCKVCFDAGKEYTSHYLKSAPGPDGKLVCPTLLNQACLTCGQKGHTSSYCKKVDKRPNKPDDEDKDKRRSRRRPAPEFADALHEEQAQEQAQEQFVQSQTKRVPSYNPRNNSYGALHSEESNPEPHAQSIESRPFTMAERLKAKLSMQPQAHVQQSQLQKPKLPVAPKSQFWWQDEDD